MARFEAKTVVNAPVRRVFDFMIRPAEVRQILPPEAGITYLDVPEVVEAGSRLVLQVSGFGPPRRIVHDITAFEPPQRFVETQVEGPLGKYIHEHLLEPLDEERTEVISRIEFEPPGGLAGFVVTEDWLRESFEKGFAHRHRELKKIMENGAAGEYRERIAG